jgi:hypothetical protein
MSKFFPIEDDLCTHLPFLYFCAISGFSLTKTCDFYTETTIKPTFGQQEITTSKRKVHESLFTSISADKFLHFPCYLHQKHLSGN